jgi:hypothetical protein
MLVCVFLCTVAHETAGAARTRCSLRPLIGEGGMFMQTSGRAACEIAKSYLNFFSLAPLAGRGLG